MRDALLALAILGLAVGIGFLVFLAREQRIPTWLVRSLAIASAAALLIMLLSDWPSESLAQFWADHSVLAGVLSTVLLVAVVFLAFEDSERRRQEQLDESVTAAGLGGLVDHVVDAEIALALLSRECPPTDWGWNSEGRPLRWVRVIRDQCTRSAGGFPVPGSDPRALAPVLPGEGHDHWRSEVVDQVVRRLLGGIRDWSPVIRGSHNGTLVLIAVGQIRNDLMRLSQALSAGEDHAIDLLVNARQRLRLLAHFMDVTSGARPVRDEVLTAMNPLPLWSDTHGWAIDSDDRVAFGRRWRGQLDSTLLEVNRHA